MKIVSTTLAGRGNGELLMDALRSARAAVDEHLIICSGIEFDELKAFHDAFSLESEELRPLHFVDYEWVDDAAAARNFALLHAAAVGADWAVTLDADERLKNGEALRKTMEASASDVLLLEAANGSYAKDRAFRLPAKQRWHGRAHEYYPSMDSRELVAGASFDELGKTPEQLQRKFQKIVELLTLQLQDEPSSRWHYYLADALHGLGRLDEAIDGFRKCASTPGWYEERAWACYRAAELLAQTQRHQTAIEVCAQGLAIHPGAAELAWLAAFCSYTLGCYEDAVHWAEMSVARGEFSAHPRVQARIGFKYPPALHELPWQVLHYAYGKLGMTSASNMALTKCEAARKARESGKRSRSNWDRPGL